MSRRPRARLLTGLFAASCAWSTASKADDPPEMAALRRPEDPPPPRVDLNFLQYGAAIAFEGRAKSGDVCPAEATAPCILGSGGGLALRVGTRTQTGYWAGGAYEFSRQDAANLLRLPIMQQVRAEGRRYVDWGFRFAPYAQAAVGVFGYGSQWELSTFGPLIGAGGGVEYELTPDVFVGLGLSYRIHWVKAWRDGTGQERPNAFAHFLALELTFETRSSFARW